MRHTSKSPLLRFVEIVELRYIDFVGIENAAEFSTARGQEGQTRTVAATTCS